MKYFETKSFESILVCYFENQSAGNSFSLASAKELKLILNRIKKEKFKGLIVTNKSSIFCSGGNLKDYAKLKSKSQGIKINKEISKILKELSQAPIPTVCLVTGDCFGGGLEWISAFDTIYAIPSVFFGMWQRRIGLSWGWGGGQRLQMRVSQRILMNLLLNANSFSSYHAKQIGLIDEIYPKEIILRKAMEFLKEQGNLPALPLKKVKSRIKSIDDFKAEQTLFESLWMNPEHQMLLSKFR